MYTGLGMKVLYFSPNSMPGASRKVIAERGHNIVPAEKSADALQLIRNQGFDAVVIDDEDEDLAAIDFTIDVYRIRPTLPVFLTSDWGSELPICLGDVFTGAFATR